MERLDSIGQLEWYRNKLLSKEDEKKQQIIEFITTISDVKIKYLFLI